MPFFQSGPVVFKRVFFPALFLVYSQTVMAYPGFLQQFNADYPVSSTGQASCATCHAIANGGSTLECVR